MTRQELGEDAVNVMVLSTSWEAANEGWAPDVKDDTRLLVVSYVRGAEAYVDALRRRGAGPPAECVVIEVGLDGEGQPPGWVDVRTESPQRLAGVGIQTNEVLTQWRDTDDPILVYLDSITGLLQYAALDETYRFLHPFAGQVRQAGARGCYRFSEPAHDVATLSTLEQLFETFVRVDAEAESYRIQPSAFT